MVKISKITQQKKHQDRFNIFIERQGSEVFAFGVHEDLLVRYALRKGMELSDDDMNEIQKQDAMYRYYTLSINYLSYRMRAKSEISDYLTKKEASQQDIDYVLNRLEQEGLVDDMAFAEVYVRSKMNTSSSGPNKIRQELKQKKLTEEQIVQGLSQYSQEDEVDKLVNLINKKMQSNSKKSFREQLNQAKQAMMQKGFSREAIDLAVQSIDLSADEDDEKAAVYYQGEKAWRKYARKHEGYTLEQKVKAALFQKGFQGEHVQQFIEEKKQEESS
ncbi:recombination regulator RecX [Alkalibacillus almallahensis]|uniref:recombination regulator RecX n=1 Tax=Alkalibacillus almallahensis TaxID=1379154 RepID=UPI0014220296|nr:recombination regulator RecX [Alkalibacillus almallahensis]NIK11580.1 regulatory protein [Alkalibacillus almallahensis]